MDAAWTENWLTWAETHPLLLVGVASVLLFIEGFAVIGLFIPGLLMVFMLGALVGLGRLDATLVFTATAIGAIAGDAFNYWLGHRFRHRLVHHWPLNRFPAMHARGTAFFQQYGALSILLGRFIGPLRSFVPMISGMLGMRPRIFIPMVIITGISWVASLVIPGMLLGASLELAAAYATRLSVLLAVVVGLLWLIFWLVRIGYAAASRNTPWMMRRMVQWLRRHPRFGRLFGPLFNPVKGEMLSVAMLGLVLALVSVLLVAAVLQLLIGDVGSSLDLRVEAWLLQLRSPVSDPFWSLLATMSEWPVILAVTIAMGAWLLAHRQTVAGLHWLLAVLPVALLAVCLHQALHWMPVWPEHLLSMGSFPDLSVVLFSALLASVPMLLVRELSAQRRKWYYMVIAMVITLFVLARMALGLTYLSAAWSAVLLAVLWVSLVGIGYRVRVWGGWPVWRHTLFFAGVFVLFSSSYAALHWQQNQQLWQPQLEGHQLSQQQWWSGAWEQLPRYRSDISRSATERFNLQFAGNVELLIAQMQRQDWQIRDRGDGNWWQMISPEPDRLRLPIFRKDFQGLPAEYLLTRTSDQGLDVTRLWRSGWSVTEDRERLEMPVWMGIVSHEVIVPSAWWFSVWQADPKAVSAVSLVSSGQSIEWQQTNQDMLLGRPGRDSATVSEPVEH